MPFEIDQVIDFLRRSTEADSDNRSKGLMDLRFSLGDQWPLEIQNSRQLESRPCLTINKVDAHIRQVTNSQRQQKPRMKAHPVNSTSDPKIAEIITGICRHIEVNSDADQAYDNAFDFACRIGWGYWRIVHDYIREDSFDQDIFIRQIENPFSVYFDPNSVLPDGNDQEECLITDWVTKKAFERQYGKNASKNGFEARGTGDTLINWIDKDNIRVAEYFNIDRIKDKLVHLSNGAAIFKTQLPDMMQLQAAGLTIIGERDSYRRSVWWRKVTAFDELEKTELPGRYIPVIPVYGNQIVVDGKRKRFGMVRNARDPQVMYNFFRTSETESIGLAPKAKWLVAEGQIEGHENEWSRANTASFAYLTYKQTDLDGQAAPVPTRLQPEPPPAGALQASMNASADIQAVMGQYDPAMGAPSGPKSGKAIRAEQGQSDNSNYQYYDNLTRSIKHTGTIILDWIPKIYDTQRVLRIIGDDGKPDLVTVNEQKQDEQGIMTIMNDVTVGDYDIVMDTGPGFNTKRAEAVEAMTTMLQANPDVFKVAGDLIFRNMDFPGSEIIADRLAAANPMAQIDEKSDVPPQAQMMIKNLQQQLQQAQQQIQGLEMDKKYHLSAIQMQEQGDTQRAHMAAVTKVHDTETRSKTAEHDIAAKERTAVHDTTLKAVNALHIEEMRVATELALAKMDKSGPQVDIEA